MYHQHNVLLVQQITAFNFQHVFYLVKGVQTHTILLLSIHLVFALHAVIHANFVLLKLNVFLVFQDTYLEHHVSQLVLLFIMEILLLKHAFYVLVYSLIVFNALNMVVQVANQDIFTTNFQQQTLTCQLRV